MRQCWIVSSAAHVSGKKRSASETATWLGDHFKVALSQVKPQVDELFVSGINHIMLTCAAYSPEELDFPGLKFYPAADFATTVRLLPTCRISHYTLPAASKSYKTAFRTMRYYCWP